MSKNVVDRFVRQIMIRQDVVRSLPPIVRVLRNRPNYVSIEKKQSSPTFRLALIGREDVHLVSRGTRADDGATAA